MISPQEREAALFALAVEKPASERAAFLQAVCGSDAALRRRLDELLAAHEQPDDLLAIKVESAQPTLKLDVEDAPDEAVGQTLGRYKLLERVGEGGCGVVYVAEQTEPVRRRVALKVIKLGMDTKQVVARFEAERQALAMMDHPNIAKVLDAGTTDTGRPYFVMELVRGIKITDYCDQAQCSTKERLDLFIKVCQAIQHAHQKGIIHRDIKPSNILVTLHDGMPVPKVIDFGIAKATEGRLTDNTVYTQLHQFIGTPAYMSPEQAEMSGLDIDTRSDIYSLGVLLYELLAGSTPFDPKELMASGIDQMRKTIREKEPPRPSTRLATLQGEDLTTTAKRRSADTSKLLHQLKGDLDWIVMKCLEKDRTRRYETANGLAADLKRHLNHEPVVARPPSAAYKFEKAFRRNRVVFSAVAAVVVALLLGVLTSAWQAVRATRAEQEQSRLRRRSDEAAGREAEARETAVAARALAEQESERAKRTAETLRINAYSSDVRAAQIALNQGNSIYCRDLLRRHLPLPGQEDLRGLEWRYLWTESRSDSSVEFQHESFVVLALPLPDFKTLVTLTVDGQITVWDVLARKVILHLEAAPPSWDLAAEIALAPNGAWLAVERVNEVVVYDTTTWQPARHLPGTAERLAFTPDSQTVVTYQSGFYRFWNTATGQAESVPSQLNRKNQFQQIVFSPDGEWMFSNFRWARVIEVWRVHSRSRDELLQNAGPCIALAVSPDGHWLAAGQWDGSVTLWSLPDRGLVETIPAHSGVALGLAFSPDSRTLATGGNDQLIKIWTMPATNSDKGLTLRETLKGHGSEIWSLGYSHDGRTLISCGKDKTARFWPAQDEQRKPVRFDVPSGGTRSTLAFLSARQGLLWSKTDRRTLQGWDFRAGLRRVSVGFPFEIYPLWLNRWEDRILYGTTEGEVIAWDPLTQLSEHLLASMPTNAAGMGIVTNRGRPFVLFRSGEPSRVEAWAPGASKPCGEPWTESLKRFTEAFYLDSCKQSPDARYLINAQSDYSLAVVGGDDPAHCRFLTGHCWPIYAETFSLDSKLLASGSWDGTARVWELASGKEFLPPLRGHRSGVRSVQFTPDGRSIITAGDDSTIHFWSLKTGQELLVLDHMVSFSEQSWITPPVTGDGLLVQLDRAGSGHMMFIPVLPMAEIDAAEAKEKADMK